jgi:SAM-dependent methyltransferase
MNCPLCSKESSLVFRKSGYGVLQCLKCGHRYCDYTPPQSHVNIVYGDAYFQGGGAGYPDYLAEGRLLGKQGQRYGKLVSKYAQPGMVLDVGCAAGFLLQGYIQSGFQGKGLEPNPSMVRYGREKLGLDLENRAFEDYNSNESFDLVSRVQVIAHFADPRGAVLKANSLLKNGGHLLIETWDRNSFTARMLGSNWHEYSPPSVLHWFSRLGLEALAKDCGFEKVAHGRPIKWLDGAHAKSLLSYKLTGKVGGLVNTMIGMAVPDKLPIPYPSEDVFWLLLRKT